MGLTELGEYQAKRLAEAWVPLLEQKARQGKLHVFVSPMKRTLQTAHPMMKVLQERCGQTAVVEPAIMEFGGLFAPGDMAILEQTDALRRKGDMEGMKALLKNYQWRACGFSGQRLLEVFLWAK